MRKNERGIKKIGKKKKSTHERIGRTNETGNNNVELNCMANMIEIKH